ncbi:MAG: carboxypeptidase regulatory-like domain-containing protein [Acidimicrobiia bacterium]|nr:carboxypeptidase regulatory-like domain-containing protein [Acidimicrobiia bacterium]
MNSRPARLLAFAVLAASAVLAQTTDSVLVGIISDASGGAVPGAAVVATNTATGLTREVVSNSTGAYRIGPLTPGTYDVRTSMSGFKSQVQTGIVLQTGAVLKIDVTLEVGDVAERIEVSAAAPMLKTQETSVGGVITTSQLERIPVNGRNYTRLLILMPGTSDIQRSQGRGGLSGAQMVSVNGQRTQDNNYTLDGIDNNMMFMNSPGGSPPMDAIQEFRVATGNSAEFGRSAGANVNLAIKSGTRDLHGTAYWYVRNDTFDANEFFANRQGRGIVPFRQNQYGLAFGGPVSIPKIYNGREKTFWFANWEGFRWRRGQTAQATVPIAEMRAGDFSSHPNNIYDPLTGALDPQGRIIRQPFAGKRIPSSRISPGTRYLIDKLLPLPNRPGINNNLLATQGQSNDRDMFIARIDHTFSQKDVVFFRMLEQRVDQRIPNVSGLYTSQNRYDVSNYGFGWNHIFSPTTVLEVKYGFNHPDNPGCPNFTDGLTRAGILKEAGVSVFDMEALCDTRATFTPQGFMGAGGGGGETILDRNHSFEGKLSKVMGRHSFRMGGTFTRRAMDAQYSNPTNGNTDFWTSLTASDNDARAGHSVATMLLGYPSYLRRGFSIPRLFARQPHFEAFFQDDWRITDRLTLNVGLRWESGIRPWDVNDALGNLMVTRDAGGYKAELMWAGINPLPNPATGQVNSPPKTLGYGRSLMRNDMNNFAPRLGIAYQATRKTVVRAGAGVFYNSTFMQEINDLRKFWPYLPQQEISFNRGTIPDFKITDQGPGFGSTQAIGGWPQNPENRSPYSQQWNLFVQHQAMKDMTVEVGYVGSSNRKQIGYHGWNNAVRPGPGPVDPRRLLAASGFTGNMDGGSNKFNSEYNALQLSLNKRFSNGMQLISNYTWGRCMDDQSSLAEGKYQDFLNTRADWSRCSYDITQAFKLGYVYDLPFGRGRRFGTAWNRVLDAALGGWAVEGIVQWQTGTVSNVRTGQDRANVGNTRERPNVLRSPNLDKGQRTVDRWFDTSAFVLPEPFTWGNAGAYLVDDDGRRVFDVSIAKRFRLSEGHSLELRGEFFNFPNHPNFGAPGSGGYIINTPGFGVINSATAPRQIQFALRYAF